MRRAGLLWPCVVAAVFIGRLSGASTTITQIQLEGGTYANSAYSYNGNVWSAPGFWVLGISQAGNPNNPLLNPGDSALNLQPGAYYTYSKQASGGLGTAIRFTVVYSDSHFDQAVFQVGSLTTAAQWVRLAGSTNIGVASTGITTARRVGPTLTSDGTVNDVLQLTIQGSPTTSVAVVGSPVLARIAASACTANPPSPGVTSLLTTDASPVLWFTLSGLSQGDVIAVSYYGPNGNVNHAYDLTFNPVASAGSSYFCQASFNPATAAPGAWTARAFLNNQPTPLFSLPFTLAAPAPSSVTVVGSPILAKIPATACSANAPVPGVTSLLTTDAPPVLWFTLSGLSQGDVISVSYYDSNGNVNHAYDVTSNPVASAGTSYFCRSSFNPATAAPGAWTARAFLNSQTTPLFSLPFTLAVATPSVTVVGTPILAKIPASACSVNPPSPGVTSLLTTDAAPVLWFTLSGLLQGDVITVSYYDLNGNVNHAYDVTFNPVASAGTFYFCQPSFNPATAAPGAWTARAFRNGGQTPLFSLPFTLTAATVTVVGAPILSKIPVSACSATAPSPAVTNLLTTDAPPVLWFTLSGLLQGDVISVSYYDSNGSINHAYDAVFNPVGSSGTFYFCFPSFNPATANPGAWTAKAFRNNQTTPLFSLAFTLTSAFPTTGPIVSDSFKRADANTCALGGADLAAGGGGTHYYLPIFSGPNGPIGASLIAQGLQNNGLDVGGVQLTASPGACSNPGIRGETLPQDLNIKVDLLVPYSGSYITDAGPYFRSRAAAAGDGIIGGNSAGYWVQLFSTGEVKVTGLNPLTTIATTGVPASFNAAIVHNLQVAVQGAGLQAALDGRTLTFIQASSALSPGGIVTDATALPENSAAVSTVILPASSGSNNGTVGVAFSADPNRGLAGGQRATNLVVGNYTPLSGVAPPTGLPQLSLSPETSSLDFGAFRIGESTPQTKILQNLGNAPATISLSTAGPFGVVSPFASATAPYVLAPGASVAIQLVYFPNNAGPQTGTLTIATNDPVNRTFQVSLRGVGVPICATNTQLSVPCQPGGGTLSGFGDSSTATHDLTAEGTTDWVFCGVDPAEYKGGVNSLPRPIGASCSIVDGLYNNDPRALTWSDGTRFVTSTPPFPINREPWANPTSGGFLKGVGRFLSGSEPANANSIQTLVVHVGGVNAGGTFIAQLSDGSAPPYVDIVPPSAGQWDRNYTLVYKLASPFGFMSWTWLQTADLGGTSANTGAGGALTLAGAALSLGDVGGGGAGGGSAPPNPVGWWKLDEGPDCEAADGLGPPNYCVLDSSGNNNNGGHSGQYVAGHTGASGDWSISGGTVAGTTAKGFPAGAQPRTISAWVKVTNFAGSAFAFFEFGQYDPVALSNFYLYIDQNGHAAIGAGGNPQTSVGTSVAGNTSLLDGQWHFIAGVYAGAPTNAAGIYVDGTLDSAPGATLTQLNTQLNSSGSAWDFGAGIRGLIDEVSLYATALTASQIQSLYQGVTPGGGGAGGTSLPNSTAWWKLDEGSSCPFNSSNYCVMDSSGNNNNGYRSVGQYVAGHTGATGDLGLQSVVASDHNGNGFPAGSQPRTISAWINGTGAAGWTFFFGADDHSTPAALTSFWLYLDKSGRAGIGAGGDPAATLTTSVVGNTAVNDGKWHHIAGVYAGPPTNAAAIYVDGVLDSAPEATLTLPKTGTTASWNFGSTFAASDDVQLYSVPLSAAQIQSISKGATPGSGGGGGGGGGGNCGFTGTAADGLVSCWAFEGDTKDGTGNGADLVLQGDAALGRPGMFGQALSVSGNASSYASGTSPAFNFGTGDYTVQAWVNLSASQNAPQQTIVGQFSGATGTGWALIRYSDTTLRFYSSVAASPSCDAKCVNDGQFVNGPSLAGGAWHDIVVTSKSGAVTLYLDGVRQNGQKFVAIPASPRNSLFVGNSVAGLIDQVAIWNRALDPATEIPGLLTTGQVGASGGGPLPNPVLWLKFDEGPLTPDDACAPMTDGYVQDSSGNGNNGTIAGCALFVPGKVGPFTLTLSRGPAYVGAQASRPPVGLPVGNSPRTISGWIKVPTATFHYLFYYGDPLFGFGWSFDGALTVDAAPKTGVITGKTPVTDGQWHHIAMVYAGTATNLLEIYVDGNPDGSATITPPNTGNNAYWTTGSFDSPISLDDIQIYSVALTAAQIRSLYQGAVPGRGVGGN